MASLDLRPTVAALLISTVVLSACTGGTAVPAAAAASPVAKAVRARLRLADRRPLLVAAALALLVAVIGGGWWWASRGQAHAPIVAIDSAGGSEKSRQVARDLSVQLGNLQSARSDAFQLISGGAPTTTRSRQSATEYPKPSPS